MLSDSPGPVTRLVECFQEVATDRPCGRVRRARLPGRVPFAPLGDHSEQRRGNGGACAVTSRKGVSTSETPCVSMLTQKAEGLSLRSAQPPQRDPFSKARSSEAYASYSSPSPQLPAHNPKRKLYESPTGEQPDAISGGSYSHRRSRSMPLKRLCRVAGGAMSMPALPTYSNPCSPQPALRSCISAPEPMMSADPAAVQQPETELSVAPVHTPLRLRNLAAQLGSYHAWFGSDSVASPAEELAAGIERRLEAVACALNSPSDPNLLPYEGSQDDTMCSPAPMTLPAVCASSPHTELPTPQLLDPPPSILPMVDNPSVGVPSIRPDTLAAVLTGQHTWAVDHVKIIDCRYDYEHQGGCIISARNVQDPTQMEKETVGAVEVVDWSRTAVVFYCEFSSERGPRMFRHIRNLDRSLHLASYPALSVPHMYVLAGGYKSFQELYPHLCTGGYVRMVDTRFSAQLKEQHGLSKAAWCRKDARKKTAQPRHP